ncbi:MAG: hypothetical protein ACKOCM_12145, partial [Cyanobacteriota bacterium]
MTIDASELLESLDWRYATNVFYQYRQIDAATGEAGAIKCPSHTAVPTLPDGDGREALVGRTFTSPCLPGRTIDLPGFIKHLGGKPQITRLQQLGGIDG